MTADHRLAAPDPPGPASGPPDTPKRVDLASGRSHIHERRACRPRGASRRRRRRPSAPRALHARLRHRRRRRGPRRPPPRPPGGRYVRYRPPSGLGGRPTRRAAAALRRRCDLRQRGKRGGLSCGRRGREGRAARRRLQRHPAAQRPCTRPHARIRGVFARGAHLARTAAPGAGEVGGGGGSGGDDARDAGRRAGAVGGRLGAREGTCECGASSRGCQRRAGWGGWGTSSSPWGAAHVLGR